MESPVVQRISHLLGKGVRAADKKQWYSLIEKDGSPTETDKNILFLNKIPDNILEKITASGLINDSPGIDVVRIDLKDDPYIYNIDHYIVIEDAEYSETVISAFSAQKLTFSVEELEYLKENILIIGPERNDDHWTLELPIHIAQAKKKSV